MSRRRTMTEAQLAKAINLYTKHDCTCGDIGQRFGFTGKCVADALRRAGVALVPGRRSMASASGGSSGFMDVSWRKHA